jgi:Na+-driven multidrug efflux pump
VFQEAWVLSWRLLDADQLITVDHPDCAAGGQALPLTFVRANRETAARARTMSAGDDSPYLGRRQRLKQQPELSESLLSSSQQAAAPVGFTIGHAEPTGDGSKLAHDGAAEAQATLVRADTRHLRTGEDGVEQERSEVALLWELGAPLLVARVADEISWLLIFHYWGIMGTAYSGAGYDAYSGMQFSLVFIFGAQQALYTMVPQATGAGNEKQVGVLLQVVLFWTTVIMGVPTALSWAYMGDLMSSFQLLAVAPADCGADVGGSMGSPQADEQAMLEEARLISDYGMASNLYLLPYIWVVGLTTWLESIEVVEEAESIAALGSLAKAGLSCLFMFHLGSSRITDASMEESDWKSSAVTDQPGWPVVVGYQLNGFAYASVVAYSAQLALLLWVVFFWKRHHEKYWRGWDLAATLNPELNKRFLVLAAPLIVQYAMQNWAWFIIQMTMSSQCEDLSSAYGVTSSFTNTAGSVSTALYTAISVRVGTNLGEGRPRAAERVMKLGWIFGAVAGGAISLLLYLFRKELAGFFSDDPNVNALSIGVSGQVSLYYFLNSMMWAFWAPLEGQMRTVLPSVALTIGMWAVTVPLTIATIKYGWGGVAVDLTITGCDTPGQCASNCGLFDGPCTLAQSQLSASWWVGNLGMLTTMGLMLWACLTSDWVELTKLAQESAEIIEDDDGPEGEGNDVAKAAGGSRFSTGDIGEAP